MALAHPSHDAFISVVKRAVKALRIEYPERAVALTHEKGRIKVQLIDVSSRDGRKIESKKEESARERRDLRDAIGRLLPFEYTGDELILMHEAVPSDINKSRWVLWDLSRWSAEKVSGGNIVSPEYVTGP